MKVFLGGTCSGSTWRDELIPLLKIQYFNPVVEGEWTQEHKDRELRERETSDFLLYCITPRMEGVYSIAELIDDTNKHSQKTIFVLLSKDGYLRWYPGQDKSMKSVADMVMANGSQFFTSLEEAALYMNHFA